MIEASIIREEENSWLGCYHNELRAAAAADDDDVDAYTWPIGHLYQAHTGQKRHVLVLVKPRSQRF
jgi:hypothetical protein